MDELGFRAADGVEVFYRRWMPDGDEPSAAVLIAHGMSEHSGRYQRIAGRLRDAGYAVYALDHRGHGRTSASTGVGRLGPSGVEGIFADLDQLRRLAVDEVGAGRVVLFGHSMGAVLAQVYAERHGDTLAGLALSGSAGVNENLAGLTEMLKQAVDGGMGNEPVAALAGFSDESARTPFDWLSRDAAEVDAYLADPYCGEQHPITYGFLAGLLEMGVEVMDPSGIAAIPDALPVLLMTGSQDPASNMGEGVRELERRMRAAGLSVEAIWYEGARHEILNETNRDEVEADLVAWIDRVVDTASSS